MTGRDNTPLIKLCGLFENTSAKTGKPYYVGYLGAAKLLLLRDDKAAEGQPQWTLFIAERPERKATSAAGQHQEPHR